MSTNSSKDDDRKSMRRENFSKKKNFINKPEESEDFKIKNKIKQEFKSKKREMQEDELWEDWQEELNKYNK